MQDKLKEVIREQVKLKKRNEMYIKTKFVEIYCRRKSKYMWIQEA